MHVEAAVEVPVSEFDQEDFESNLATLLGIDPARVRVAGVSPPVLLVTGGGRLGTYSKFKFVIVYDRKQALLQRACA